jgi:hypothetical protein
LPNFLVAIWQLWQVTMSLESFCDMAHNAVAET